MSALGEVCISACAYLIQKSWRTCNLLWRAAAARAGRERLQLRGGLGVELESRRIVVSHISLYRTARNLQCGLHVL